MSTITILDLKKRLKIMNKEILNNRRKTIFLDTIDIKANIPWKYLTKDEKIYKLLKFSMKNGLNNINSKNITLYKLQNIEYEINTGTVLNAVFIKKEM